MGDIASSHHLTLLIIKIIINMGNYFNISVHSLTTEKNGNNQKRSSMEFSYMIAYKFSCRCNHKPCLELLVIIPLDKIKKKLFVKK